MGPYSIPVSLIRQFMFCPRIPFFLEVAGIQQPIQLWVKQGIDYHLKMAELMKRRSLQKFGLNNPTIHYSPKLKSLQLNIHGIPDALLEDEQQIVPIEFKNKMPKLTKATMFQLMCYGLLAEEQFKKTFKTALVIVGLSRKIHTITRTEALDRQTNVILHHLRKVLNQGVFPDSSASYTQCGQCEFLKYCNDRF
ncbi:MAG: CRISPR-associated protein Cas4 [Kiritimatiellae bacterium]|nr:CRISPR-associated protein Cas4 [Kiritimatiellia bacterium]